MPPRPSVRRPVRRAAGRGTSRPYHHGNLRRALLDEALATIRRDGVEALTLRAVGTRLGVSRTALYRHFTDKQALLTAVATEGFRTLRGELVAAWLDAGQGLDGFNAQGRAYVRFATANPAHYRVMFGGFVAGNDRDPDLAAEATGAFQALVDVLAALQAAGLVRPGDLQPLARYVWAVVHGLAMLIIDRRLPPEDTAGDAFIRFALDRLREGIVVASGRQRAAGR